MDRVKQGRKKSHRLIAQRYLLQTELISNKLGTLYQARDMRAADPETAAVLIHLLPTQALPQVPLKLMAERLQVLSAQTDQAVLKVLESGWLNSEPYFVLASPPSWSLASLPPMLGQSTRLHEQALRLNQSLTEQGLLTGALPTALFLVSADGSVYLPSTALIPSLQTIAESPELLLKAHLLPPSSRWSAWPWLGLGFMGVVAASGAGWYYQNYLMTSQVTLPANTEAANSPSLFEAANQLDLPQALPTTAVPEQSAPSVRTTSEPEALTTSTPKARDTQPLVAPSTDLVLMDKPRLPDPEPGDMRLALASEPNKPQLRPRPAAPAVPQPISNRVQPMQDKNTQLATASPKPTKISNQPEPKSEKKPMPQPEAHIEFIEEPDPSVNLPAPHTPLIRPTEDKQLPRAQFTVTKLTPNPVAVVPAPQPAKTLSTTAVLGVVNPVVTAPTPVVRLQTPSPERDPEALTANGMTSEELVKKAYQALQAGRLDEQANQGAVYFIRLLERIDHGNPQIIRLARETSYQLHQQVRTDLTQGEAEQASQKLWRAGRIIKEFNLVHLNPAQVLLEHKLAE